MPIEVDSAVYPMAGVILSALIAGFFMLRKGAKEEPLKKAEIESATIKSWAGVEGVWSELVNQLRDEINRVKSDQKDYQEESERKFALLEEKIRTQGTIIQKLQRWIDDVYHNWHKYRNYDDPPDRPY